MFSFGNDVVGHMDVKNRKMTKTWCKARDSSGEDLQRREREIERQREREREERVNQLGSGVGHAQRNPRDVLTPQGRATLQIIYHKACVSNSLSPRLTVPLMLFFNRSYQKNIKLL